MVRIRRNIGHGWEIVEAKLPVLVTVIETANEPRPPAAQAGDAAEAGPGAGGDRRRSEGRHARRRRGAAWPPRRSAASRPCKQQGLLIEQWNLDDIHADLNRCGLAGSPTKVFRIQAIVLTKEGYTDRARPPKRASSS